MRESISIVSFFCCVCVSLWLAQSLGKAFTYGRTGCQVTTQRWFPAAPDNQSVCSVGAVEEVVGGKRKLVVGRHRRLCRIACIGDDRRSTYN